MLEELWIGKPAWAEWSLSYSTYRLVWGHVRSAANTTGEP